MSEPQFQDIEPETPICADCQHLVGKRSYYENAAEWKCAHPDNVSAITKDPVTGMNVYHYRLSSCYVARGTEISCGPKGAWFQKYEHVPHNPSGLNLGGKAKKPLPSAESLLGELGL